MSVNGIGKDKKQFDLNGIDSSILGQLITAQNILFVLPTKKNIAEFYTKLLSSVPGVAACRVCLGNSYSQEGEFSNEICSDCENINKSGDENSFYSKDFVCKFDDLPNAYVLALDTIDHRFGFFIFIINQPELFELYKPFINNLGNFVALSLENRFQKNNLQKMHDDLDKKVEERTMELNSINIQLEKELNEKKRTEQRIRMLAENFPDFVVRFDRECRHIYVNPAIEKVFGLPAEAIIGKTLKELPLRLDQEQNDRLMKLIRRVFEEGIISECEAKWDTEKGLRIFEIRYTPEIDATGNVVSVLSIARDITERKRSEEALRESEEKYRMVFENSPISLWEEDFSQVKTLFDDLKKKGITDIETYFEQNPETVSQCIELTKIVDVNEAALNLHEATNKEELLGRLANTFTSDSFETFKRELIHLWNGGSGMTIDTVIKTLSGNIRNVNVNFSICSGHEKTLSKIIVSMVDITERKQAEQEIIESKLKLTRYIANFPAFFFTFRKSSNGIYQFPYASPGIKDLYGLDPEDVQEDMTPLHMLAHPEDRPHIEESLAEAFQTLDPFRIEFRICRPGLPERWLECRSIAVPDKEGNPLWHGIMLDVTDRKRMEEALAEREREFRTLAENSPDNIIRYDSQCRAIYCNKKIFTTDPKMILGKTPVELGAGGFRNDTKYEEHIRGVLENGKSSEMELVLGNPDGELKNHLIRFVPEYNAEGSISGVLVIGQDITERKRTEEALKAREMELHNLADSSPGLMGTFYLRPDGSVCMPYTSPQLKELFGLNSEDVIDDATPLLSRTHPDDMQLVNDTIAESARTMTPWHCEYRVIHPTKGELWLEGSTNPKPHPAGGVIWYGFVHNITNRKLMEKEISKLNQELEQRVINRTIQLEAANKELEAFAYSVSHDLRAPLRGIDGFSLALLEDYQEKLDEKGRDSLYRVRTAAQHMSQLIDDILKLSKVSRTEMNIQSVNLSAIAREITNNLSKQQPERIVEFIIQPDIIVKGDTHLLNVVLVNLFDNAWKFTSKHQKACIEFGMLKQENKSVYFIKDDGAGFDISYSQKLFGAFQRFHTTSEFPGTGIGLATVSRIIHRHGGEIWAESEIEKGTTFYFNLKTDRMKILQ